MHNCSCHKTAWNINSVTDLNWAEIYCLQKTSHFVICCNFNMPATIWQVNKKKKLIANVDIQSVSQARIWLLYEVTLHWLLVRNRVDFKIATFVYRSLSGMAPAYLAAYCQLTVWRRSSWAAFCRLEDLWCHAGGPTATLGTNVLRLPDKGCGTVFQLVLGKWTSAMNSLSGH